MERISFVVLVLASVRWAEADFSLVRSKRQAEFLRREVKNFVVVRPFKATHLGHPLSHDVRHFNDITTRVRRSVSQEDTNTVHYVVPEVLGNHKIIQLTPNRHLLAPGIVVERRHGKNLLNSTRKRIDQHCFFNGHINGTDKSYVVLSTCYGLVGIIRTEAEEFFIEPLKGHPPNSSLGQPHVIYKRSALINREDAKPSYGSCGNRDDETLSLRLEELHEDEETMAQRFKRRKKRSVSVERNVETLVVADKMMVDYYSDEDIETYILTVMNMVSTLYHDASIGNAINIVLVRMILLENEAQEKDEELLITQHADNTLKSFCKWQKFINPKDENHPNHHDVAILLTRYNICTKTNEPCSTLGLAEVAGMCQPHRSCNVNEDTGLALAYTIAHEMGHNFGMSHDGPHNGCQAPFGERQHVMSPHLNSDASPFVWSNCSRSEITKFLDRDWGSCLNDEPSDHEFTFPEVPPGAMYDADHQCRLQYGPDAGFCEGIEDVCQTLWCRQDSKCVTRLEPAAEGTLCDRNMWCYMGRCTTIGERPETIDGEWNHWSPWSECSRSCGAGVMHSERHCDNPSPSWGGRYCIGERKRYKICNSEKCSESSPSFRAVQCSEFDDIPYKDELHTWLPVSTPMTPCQLHCKPDGQFFSVMLSDTVADGTECNPGTNDICINGKCRRVSCDWGIDSNAQEDRCGVCHGDGTQCLTIKGRFDLKVGLGYVEVVKVPKGARNIRVEEEVEATNYIAVSAESGEFYLNGQWFIQWSGEYKAAGTTLYYQRDGERETLHAPGPITENLQILLLYQTENPGLTYEYTIPNMNVTRKPEFHWEHTGWTVCSATCGGGLQVSKAKCFEREAGLVEDKYCDPKEKPTDMSRICNKHRCPPKWWTGPWQHCSVSCGENGVRKRTVICVRSLGPDEQIALLEEECDQNERPTDQEQCHKKQPCKIDPASWDTGQWTDVCSEDPCNHQSRHVYCTHPSGNCETKKKPTARRQCGNITCGNWVVGNWSECSKTCGVGIRRRNVSCRGGVLCHKATEPPSQEVCSEQLCAISSNSQDDEMVIPQEIENFIPGDDDDVKKPKKEGQPHKHRHRHPTGKHRNEIEDYVKAKPKKVTRPRGIVKDMMPIPMIEIENLNLDVNLKESTNNDVDEIEVGTIRKEPAVIPYGFTDEVDDIDGDDDDDDDTEPEGHKYAWKASAWSKCSERCDGGRRRREAMCLDTVTKHMVVEELCDHNTRPSTEEPCNQGPCLEWVISEWSQCSVTCGEGLMRREVTCPKPSMCNQNSAPAETMSCSLRPCLDWVDGSWSRCSATCGGGTQIRHVKCVNLINQGPATGCDPGLKPSHRQKCATEPCPDNSSAFHQCEDKMEGSMCKSLRHMCSTYYFKTKCCATCSRKRLRHLAKISPRRKSAPKRKET